MHNTFDVFLCVPCRRNEQIIGSKFGVGKQPGALTIIGDDPKKYAAAVVEYTKVIVKYFLEIIRYSFQYNSLKSCLLWQ